MLKLIINMPITLKKLKDLLTSPHEILPKIAKERNVNEATVMLVINWVLISTGLALSSQNYSIIPAVIVFGIIATLTTSFLIQLSLTILGGKGDYSSALAASTYPFFGLALSSLIVSIIFFWSDKIAVILGTFLFVLYFTVALTGAFRVLKESFKVDIITVWIVTSLLMLAIFGSMYIMFAIYVLKVGTTPLLLTSVA